jgi:hypothetical protein
MKRRELLLAASGGALASAPLASMAATVPKGFRHDASSAALLPMRLARDAKPSALIEAVWIGKAYPDPGATGSGSLSLDLVVIIGRTPIAIQAWQQTRNRSGQAMAASGVFMPFIDGRVIDLQVTVRSGIAGDKASSEWTWTSPLSSGGVYLLATRRRSTGLPPLPADLRWDESSGLVVPDAAGHDFDAVLLTTA